MDLIYYSFYRYPHTKYFFKPKILPNRRASAILAGAFLLGKYSRKEDIKQNE